jgi:hypothetical protein
MGFKLKYVFISVGKLILLHDNFFRYLLTFTCLNMEKNCKSGHFLDANQNLDLRVIKLLKAQESIPRNQFRQPMRPGGPVRRPYSHSVPNPHRLFKNFSTGSVPLPVYSTKKYCPALQSLTKTVRCEAGVGGAVGGEEVEPVGGARKRRRSRWARPATRTTATSTSRMWTRRASLT